MRQMQHRSLKHRCRFKAPKPNFCLAGWRVFFRVLNFRDCLNISALFQNHPCQNLILNRNSLLKPLLLGTDFQLVLIFICCSGRWHFIDSRMLGTRKWKSTSCSSGVGLFLSTSRPKWRASERRGLTAVLQVAGGNYQQLRYSICSDLPFWMETVIAPEEELSRVFLPSQSNQLKLTSQLTNLETSSCNCHQISAKWRSCVGFGHPSSKRRQWTSCRRPGGMAGCRFTAWCKTVLGPQIRPSNPTFDGGKWDSWAWALIGIRTSPIFPYPKARTKVS